MFWPGVGLCSGREKAQNPCISNWIWRDHEGTIANTWGQNHNAVQSVAAIKWFRRERVAVKALHTIAVTKYLVWPRTKQLYRAKWPLCCAESVDSNVSSKAYTCTIITIITITPIILIWKTNPQFSRQSLLLLRKLEHRSHYQWCRALPLDPREYTWS